MQYLVAVLDSHSGSATPSEMAAIDAYNERLRADGHWVFAGGLADPGTATVIDNRGDDAMVTTGPFVETTEYIAGFWILSARDLDQAVALATEGSKHCNRRVEVRQILGG